MNKKLLGKIVSAKYGRGGREDAFIGLSLAFEGKGWGVSTFINYKQCDDGNYLKTQVLDAAKVLTIDKLVGKPVEVEFAESLLKDWRILDEVL